MNKGIVVVVFPVKDMAQSKAIFSKFLGIEPYADSPYYVGFKVGNMDIGLDPNGHKDGMTAYYKVDNIKQSLQIFVEAGASVIEEVKDVGGGRLIASVRDTNGVLIGILQDP